MEKIYKLIKRKVIISPNIRKIVDLNAEVYSQDIDVTKIVVELESENGEQINLTNATVTVGLKINNVTIEDAGQVESVEEKSISYCPGERFKISEGIVTLGFFVTLDSGQRIDIQNYKINFKRSLIDTATEEDVKPYFASLDSIVSELQKHSNDKNSEIDESVNQAKSEISNKVNIVETAKESAINQIDNYVNEKKATIDENIKVSSDFDRRLSDLESRNDNDTIYDDTELRNRVVVLENKADKDTVYDDTNIKQSISDVNGRVDKLSNKVSVLEDRPIVEPYDDTNVVSRIESLEGKVDKDTIYDDSELRNRIVVLENKPDNDTIYDDSEIKQKIAEIEANAPAVHLAYADSEDGSVGFTKFKPPIVLDTTFLNTTKRYVGMSVKDSNDYRDYVWMPNPELSKNWQYYELAATILDDCAKTISTLYNFGSASKHINNVVGATITKGDPYINLMQKATDTNAILQFGDVYGNDMLFSFIAEQYEGFDNDWYLLDANNNKTYIHSGLNIIFAKPRMIGKDGDIVNPLVIRNTLCYATGRLTFNFALTQDEIIKITTLAHNTYTQKFTIYQKIMSGIVLYAYPQGSIVLMQNDMSPSGLLKRGVWSKLGEIALTNPDGKLYAYVRVL